MNGVTIEVERAATGGTDSATVIRLVGIFKRPPRATFRLEPVGTDAVLALLSEWPSGDLEPSDVRIGAKGVELILPPEVSDAAPLQSRPRVAIAVPGAALRREVTWPLPARKLAGVAEEASAPADAPTESERRAHDIAMRARARRAELERLLGLQGLQAPPTDAHAVGQDAAPAGGSGADETDALARLDQNLKLLSSEMPAVPVPAFSENPQAAAIAAAAAAAIALPPRAPAVSPPHVNHTATPVIAPPLPSRMNLVPPPLPPLHQAALPAIARSQPPSVPVPQRMMGENAIGHMLSSPGHQQAFGLGFLVALLLAGLSVFALRGDLGFGPSQAAVETVSPAASLSTIIDVPNVSVRGVPASDIAFADALKRADGNLYSSDSANDKAEAKFWLRKSVGMGLGDPKLVWALTQLGTLYASPAVGAPDYQSARSLWELASANGDPVALCFLASLHEHGLGVEQDRGKALNLYRKSKARGGCRDVDVAVARLSKAAP